MLRAKERERERKREMQSLENSILKYEELASVGSILKYLSGRDGGAAKAICVGFVKRAGISGQKRVKEREKE